jgi:hypothetical protein
MNAAAEILVAVERLFYLGLIQGQWSGHQPKLPASVHTVGPVHCGSDSAECKGKHLIVGEMFLV